VAPAAGVAAGDGGERRTPWRGEEQGDGEVRGKERGRRGEGPRERETTKWAFRSWGWQMEKKTRIRNTELGISPTT